MDTALKRNLNSGNNSLFGKLYYELLPIYSADGEPGLDIDGVGVDVFGIVNFTCHLTAYVKTQKGTTCWVRRRSRTKKPLPACWTTLRWQSALIREPN